MFYILQMKKYILPRFQNATQSVKSCFFNDSKQRRMTLSRFNKTANYQENEHPKLMVIFIV